MARLRNPFAKTAKTDGSATDDTTRDDALVVLGEPVVDKLAAVVDATPGLLTTTASSVQPEDVDDATITIVGYTIDTSLSALNYMAIQGQSHDEFVDALVPALKEGVTILMTCSTLDGTVVYPLTRLQDVRKFGRQSRPGDHTAENGLTYGHMKTAFRMLSYSPIRDRVKEQVSALLAEMVKWANPRVARTVNLICAGSYDGFTNRWNTSPTDLRDFIGEIEDGGYFTEVAYLIADVESRGYRRDLEENIIFNRATEKELQATPATKRREMLGHLLPDGHADMSNVQLTRWWFYEQGLAADDDRLFLPGTDPKAIRRATGQMSQVAFQASVGAFREGGSELDTETAE